MQTNALETARRAAALADSDTGPRIFRPASRIITRRERALTEREREEAEEAREKDAAGSSLFSAEKKAFSSANFTPNKVNRGREARAATKKSSK